MNIQQAAESVSRQLMKNIAGYTDELPIIRRSGKCVEVILESGPFEWTTNDNYGLFVELKGYGLPGEYKFKAYWKAPKGFYVEAINHYSVAVYKD